MAIQFGAGDLTVSGVSIARLNKIDVNISYDNMPLRGGNLIFPTFVALYNGTVEGSFEVVDINLTAIAGMLGATVSFANGSGTTTLTASQVLVTGADIVCTSVTNGVTGIFTMDNTSDKQLLHICKYSPVSACL